MTLSERLAEINFEFDKAHRKIQELLSKERKKQGMLPNGFKESGLMYNSKGERLTKDNWLSPPE